MCNDCSVRRGGLKVSARELCALGGSRSNPGGAHCFVFLSNALYSHSKTAF